MYFKASTIIESLVALVIISIATSIGIGVLASISEVDKTYQDFKVKMHYEKERVQHYSGPPIEQEVTSFLNENEQFKSIKSNHKEFDFYFLNLDEEK